MRCGDVASRPPITITPDKTLEEAVEILAGHDVGLLVIVDRNNPRRPIGVLSERDVIRAIAGKAPLTVAVDKVGTTSGLVYVHVDDPITLAAEKMAKYNIRHVLVLDRNGELYGVISIRDILKIQVPQIA